RPRSRGRRRSSCVSRARAQAASPLCIAGSSSFPPDLGVGPDVDYRQLVQAIRLGRPKLMRRSMVRSALASFAVVAALATLCASAMAQIPLAPGQRVSVNFAGGKQGTVVRIGTAADGTYEGCTRIHFDYEGPDPTTGQWFCPWNSPFTITPLGG